MSPPLRVALTGGIATGKSYCLAQFAQLGVPVIDSDQIAREVVGPGTPGLAAIRDRFGAAILQSDGTLDRRALGRIVFSDIVARRDIEAIVHPAVYRAIDAWFDKMTSEVVLIGIADVPLLYETGHEREFDRVIVAACSVAQQLERLLARGDLSPEEARQRIEIQLPIKDKADRADYVIDTSRTMAETDRQVVDVWERLTTIDPRRGGLQPA